MVVCARLWPQDGWSFRLVRLAQVWSPVLLSEGTTVKLTVASALEMLIGLALVGAPVSKAAADARYTMQPCGGGEPCAFILDTETGAVRMCRPTGCIALDAMLAPAGATDLGRELGLRNVIDATKSALPLAPGSGPGGGAQPFPLAPPGGPVQGGGGIPAGPFPYSEVGPASN